MSAGAQEVVAGEWGGASSTSAPLRLQPAVTFPSIYSFQRLLCVSTAPQREQAGSHVSHVSLSRRVLSFWDVLWRGSRWPGSCCCGHSNLLLQACLTLVLVHRDTCQGRPRRGGASSEVWVGVTVLNMPTETGREAKDLFSVAQQHVPQARLQTLVREPRWNHPQSCQEWLTQHLGSTKWIDPLPLHACPQRAHMSTRAHTCAHTEVNKQSVC